MPYQRPEFTYTDIKGGIIIDNVTVDLTIKNVTIKSGGASGWNLAGIYLKGNAQLNLTLEGTNTLVGLDEGAGIEVEKDATLVITEQSSGSLTAVEVPYGPPVSEEKEQQVTKVQIITVGQERL